VRFMKIALLLPVAFFVAATAWGQTVIPKSAIVDSAHDMRVTFNAPSYSLCNFCHVVHKTASVLATYPNAPGALLWNHMLSNVSSYGVYSSASFDALGTDIADLGNQQTVSNLCLSCHDGTVAINSFYEPIRGVTTSPTFMPGDTRINDLTRTHPVNFTYNAALANAAHIRVPVSASSVDAAGDVPLFAGKMQCATCHDPHNGTSAIFERPFPEQASGTFCTYCHL
jgi:hypothetical protein